jgi:hypothetical protein
MLMEISAKFADRGGVVGRRGFLVSVPLLVGAVALCSCVTLRVNMDFDREADFAVYRTYAWHEGDVSLEDDNPSCTSG